MGLESEDLYLNPGHLLFGGTLGKTEKLLESQSPHL